MGGGFFRIFNKSATLLFKHPTTELNPNKPYKGTVTTSREHHAVTKKASTLGASRRTPEEYHYYRRHQRWPSLTRLDKISPTPIVAARFQGFENFFRHCRSSEISYSVFYGRIFSIA
jgi:hypothetical protein